MINVVMHRSRLSNVGYEELTRLTGVIRRLGASGCEYDDMISKIALVSFFLPKNYEKKNIKHTHIHMYIQYVCVFNSMAGNTYVPFI